MLLPPQPCTSRWSQQDTDQQQLFITNLILLRLQDKESLSIVTQLHVQVYRLPIDFNVDLARGRRSLSITHQ